MAVSPPPDKRMLMRIPVGGCHLDGCDHLLPGLKASALEGQRAQELLPGFNQVQVRGVLGLVDELEAADEGSERAPDHGCGASPGCP